MRKRQRVELGVAGVLVLATLGSSGCASMAPARYHEFAQAGTAYTAVFDTLAYEASRVAVRLNSKELLWNRSSKEDRRIEELSAHDEAMAERLAVTADLRRHAALLADYFAALDELATSDAPEAASKAAGELADTLVEVGARVSSKGLGEVGRFADVLKPLTNLVVGNVRRAALRRELVARAETLARELALQRAAVRALADQLQADLQVEAEHEATDFVARPYVSGPVPNDWVDRRWQVLTSQLNTGLGERASRVVRRMELTFAQLTSGKAGKAEVKELLQELQDVARTLQAVQNP